MMLSFIIHLAYIRLYSLNFDLGVSYLKKKSLKIIAVITLILWWGFVHAFSLKTGQGKRWNYLFNSWDLLFYSQDIERMCDFNIFNCVVFNRLDKYGVRELLKHRFLIQQTKTVTVYWVNACDMIGHKSSFGHVSV